MSAAASALPRLRIVVVDDDPLIRRLVTEVLSRQLGHTVVGEADSGPSMVDRVLATRPDIVVMDIHLPEMNGLDALRRIQEERIVPAVAITGDRDGDLVARAVQEQVMAYLVKPIDPTQLQAALHLAWARFQEWQELAEENASLRQSLHERKLVERAKGLLMTRFNWSEPEAFRRLQRTAMNRRQPMAELAQDVLEGRVTKMDAL